MALSSCSTESRYVGGCLSLTKQHGTVDWTESKRLLTVIVYSVRFTWHCFRLGSIETCCCGAFLSRALQCAEPTEESGSIRLSNDADSYVSSADGPTLLVGRAPAGLPLESRRLLVDSSLRVVDYSGIGPVTLPRRH